jgi:hypothetical protein
MRLFFIGTQSLSFGPQPVFHSILKLEDFFLTRILADVDGVKTGANLYPSELKLLFQQGKKKSETLQGSYPKFDLLLCSSSPSTPSQIIFLLPYLKTQLVIPLNGGFL